MLKKTSLTIYEKCENVMLTKSVGQIGYQLYKQLNFDSTILTYKNESEYSYLKNEVKGLKIKFIPKIKIGSLSLSVCYYLIKNAKSIDLLYLLHHRDKNYVYAFIYKFLNKNGKIVFSSDIDIDTLKKQNHFFKYNSLKYLKRKFLFNLVNKKIDIYFVKTKEVFDYYIKNKLPSYEKLFLLRNGIDIEFINKKTKVQKYENKKNNFLTVGRIGAKEKNHQMILKALSNIDLKDWKFYFIGPIEEKFRIEINTFFKKFPDKKNNIIFTGPIYDKVTLYKYYNESKIFCLTSNIEGFPVVFPEAAYFGNFIITTDIGGSKDISNNKKLGKVIKKEDINLFSEYIQKIISNDESINLEKNYYQIQKYANNNFSWEKNVKDLYIRVYK